MLNELFNVGAIFIKSFRGFKRSTRIETVLDKVT